MARILCVEDDERVREPFVRFLRLKGHEVVEAKDGQEAVALASQTRFALVLLDVKMPKLDGVAALRRILDASPITKAIVMTGFTLSDELRQTITEAGAAECLSKPVTFSRLEELTQRLLTEPG